MDDATELQMLRAASKASRTGGWRWFFEEDRVEWTAVTFDLFEVAPETRIDLELATAFYEAESLQRLAPAIEACKETGAPWDLVTRCRTASGKMFWSRSTGRALKDETGRIVALEGAFQDITSERDALEALEAAEDDLSSVLTTMPDGFFLLNEDWEFVFVNPASRAMLQRNPTDILGRNIWEEFPEALGSQFEAVYSRVMGQGISESFIAYFEPLNTWFLVSAHRSERGVAVHFRDVTATILEQEKLRTFRAALEAMDAGAVILEIGSGKPDFTVATSYTNLAARKMGLASLEALEENLASRPGEKRLRDLIALEKPSTFECEATSDSGIRKLSVMVVPMVAGSDPNHPSQYATILISDVTDSWQAEEKQRKTERLALLGQMAGGVSHDFNNLLSVVLGNTELLELVEDIDERSELIREVREAVRRGQSLNDSLLAFSGRSRLQPKTEDLGKFLTTLQPLLQRTLTSRISLNLTVEPGLPQVLLDTAMAESCVLNLVINARDAIAGTGSVKIILRRADTDHDSCDRLGSWVQLAVVDTGSGIPKEHHERVFEPFFSTKGPAKASGLGLARVKGFAEQLGGFVSLKSKPGEGTEVAMNFPAAALQVPSNLGKQSAHRRDGCGLKVLVVDDTPAVALVAARMLSAEGCATRTVNSAEAAREAIREHGPFDVVLTDVVMPQESGVQLALDLIQENPSLAVVLMSGYPDVEPQNALPAGMTFLSKPVSREQLRAALENLKSSGPNRKPVRKGPKNFEQIQSEMALSDGFELVAASYSRSLGQDLA